MTSKFHRETDLCKAERFRLSMSTRYDDGVSKLGHNFEVTLQLLPWVATSTGELFLTPRSILFCPLSKLLGADFFIML